MSAGQNPIIAILLSTAILFSSVSIPVRPPEPAVPKVERDDWEPAVRATINELIDTFGCGRSDRPYAVFDFDNTTSVFDAGELYPVYQIQTMSFAVDPEEFEGMISALLEDKDRDLTEYGFGKGSFRDWIADITDAYTILYGNYGPFSAEGVSGQLQKQLEEDPDWQEFSAKLRALYDLILKSESAFVAYPWVGFWTCGMTEQEVYESARRCLATYREKPSEEVTWRSPSGRNSRTGQVEVTWKSGISVTGNTRELMKALSDAGIDVWICSASSMDIVRAAVDEWELHDSVTGVIAMTDRMEGGKYVAEYDYERGVFRTAEQGGRWVKGDRASRALIQGEGKVQAICNILYPRYGHGPVAGFMDSTGDFEFCTQFDSLRLVVCFNCARDFSNGGGLIAATSVYQQDVLGYHSIGDAARAGDTLYMLQGRDENGPRSFRPSRKTIPLGECEEVLLNSGSAGDLLKYWENGNLSTEEIINTFCLKTDADCSPLGFGYGFLPQYAGYHSIR